jgi:O-antigen/teichoic acid export membrane protein
MSLSRQVALGGAYLATAQLVVGVGQLLYASVTARLVADESFGAFAVAMSATGLVALFLTTGMATYALATDAMTRQTARTLKCVGWAAGLATAVLVWFFADGWVALWAGTSAATRMLRMLCLQVLLSAPAAVSVALLRRQARPAADAAVQLASVVLGLIAGVVGISVIGTGDALVIAPTVTAALTLLLSSLLARPHEEGSRNEGLPVILGFAWRISNQNVIFFVLMSLPVWAVSRAAGPEELGQFSRALVLTQTPAFALAGAMVRAVQPFYRLAGEGRLRASVDDSVSLSAWLAFPMFFGLAACAVPTVEVVLGPGWSKTSQLVLPLALGFGLYVVFSVAANAAQTLGAVRQVTIAQSTMLPVCVAVSAAGIFADSAFIAAVAFPAMLSVGLLVMLHGLSARGIASLGIGLRNLGWHLAAASLAAVVAFATWTAMLAASWGTGWSLVLPASAGLLSWLAVAWALPGGRVLRSRGVLARVR